METYYYFLSYTRRHQDGYVARFHADLSDRLADRLRLPDPHRVGFRDVHEIHAGMRWREELEQALRSCRCFVPLYSAEYFDSAYCGREWAVFLRRLRTYEALENIRPNLVVPVLWRPVPEIPRAVEGIQYVDDGFPVLYRERGMEYLVRRARATDVYEAALERIADRIVAECGRHLLPPCEPFSIEQVTGTFGELVLRNGSAAAGSGAPGGTGGAGAETGRRGHVTFLLAAATRGNPPPGHPDPDPEHAGPASCYGSDPLDWNPYSHGRARPDEPAPEAPAEHGRPHGQPHEPPLSTHAQQVVSGNRFSSAVDVVDEWLVDRVAKARRNHQVVVVLVDPWSARMAEYGDALRGLDARLEPASGVLLPAHGDPEEAPHEAEKLSVDIGETFPNNLALPVNPRFQYAVPREHFGRRLMEMVAAAQSALARLANPRADLRGSVPPPFRPERPPGALPATPGAGPGCAADRPHRRGGRRTRGAGAEPPALPGEFL
jgi:FxsC-like protein